jgi:hypothetical protein
MPVLVCLFAILQSEGYILNTLAALLQHRLLFVLSSFGISARLRPGSVL